MTTETAAVVISKRDPMMIDSFEDVIAEIESSLLNMRMLALNTNFEDSAQRDNYQNNVTYLKRFYERAERLVVNESQ